MLVPQATVAERPPVSADPTARVGLVEAPLPAETFGLVARPARGDAWIEVADNGNPWRYAPEHKTPERIPAAEPRRSGRSDWRKRTKARPGLSTTSAGKSPSLLSRLAAWAVGGPVLKTLSAVVGTEPSDLPQFLPLEFDFEDPESPHAKYDYRMVVVGDMATLVANHHGCDVNRIVNWANGCPVREPHQRIRAIRDGPHSPYRADGVPILTTRKRLQTTGEFGTEFRLELPVEVLFPKLGASESREANGVPVTDYGHWLEIHPPWSAEPLIAVESPGSEGVYFSDAHSGQAKVLAYRDGLGDLQIVPPGRTYDRRTRMLAPAVSPGVPNGAPGEGIVVIPDPDKWKSTPEFISDRWEVVWRNKHSGETVTVIPEGDMVIRDAFGRIFDRSGERRLPATDHGDPNTVRLSAGSEGDGNRGSTSARGTADGEEEDEAGSSTDSETDSCFVAGTLVHTAQGLEPIETIQPGDWVWARDEKTGEQALRAILGVKRTPDQEVLEVQLEGEQGADRLGVTANHPFYVEGRGFVDAGDLRQNDLVPSLRGEMLRVVAVIHTGTKADVFNFAVDEMHT